MKSIRHPGSFNDSLTKLLLGIYAFFFAVLGLFPFLMIIGGSFTDEREIMREGYKLIPETFSLRAYDLLFLQPEVIVTGYRVTSMVTIVGTTASILVMSMLAFAMSCKWAKYRRFISIYALVTMLFNGGMVPWFIVCSNVLKLRDTIWALIIPTMVNVFNVFLLRNYFNTIPHELSESAKIDGAGDGVIFFRIIFPLAVPVLATVSLFSALNYWNDWWLGIMLIDDDRLKPLQLVLRAIVSNITFLRSTPEAELMLDTENVVPSESIKLATCLVTAGPIIFLYPFLQRYFVKGIMIGAVKG